MRFRSLVASLLLLAACSRQPTSATSQTSGGFATVSNAEGDKVPAGWDARTMLPSEVDDLPHHGITSMRILAWRVYEDDRLYAETAILWVLVRQRGMEDRWLLLNVFRHPREGSDWHLSAIVDTDVTGIERFNTPPTKADLDRFLVASAWSEGAVGFRMLASGTCEHGTRSAVGE